MRKLLILFPMLLVVSGTSSGRAVSKLPAVYYLAYPISSKVDLISRKTAELIPLKR
ncbi:hypothetical protein [Pedobacter sp. L105]|uniref:hypothetical protein n=1 Tax=Pedobacter sp. L105 TaxID=1641871 RepID=UPI00131BCB16|nr:hypothetical protein [Pedobacter sp. L105]